MPHRVLERDVNLNLGGLVLVGCWGVALALGAVGWLVPDGDKWLHASVIVGLFGVGLGQLKGNMRQRSMCAARLDLAEVRRAEGVPPIRRVQ